MKVICGYCKKEFDWPSRQKRYCSEECKKLGSKSTHPNYYDKVCVVCGKSFRANNVKAIYCSHACNTKHFHEAHKQEYKHICLNCENEFMSFEKETKFCSHSCAGLYKNKIGIGIMYFCKNCGQEFYQKHKRHFFCSDECKREYGAINSPKKNVNCSNCGKEIIRIRSLNREHYFCSRKCESEFRIEEAKDIRYCETCGKEFVCRKCDELRFCSCECQAIWQSKERCGKNSPTYNHEITDEMRVKNCEYCGKEMIGTPKEFEIKRFCSFACKVAGLNKSLTKPHREICSLLNNLNISFDIEVQFGRYSIDNFLLDYNLAIEIMGGFWHCDIRFYPKAKSKLQENSFSRDKRKKELLKNKNIPILYLWEYDIENNINLCEKLILEFIKKNGILDNYHSMNYSIDGNDLLLNNEILVPHFENDYISPLTTEQEKPISDGYATV